MSKRYRRWPMNLRVTKHNWLNMPPKRSGMMCEYCDQLLGHTYVEWERHRLATGNYQLCEPVSWVTAI